MEADWDLQQKEQLQNHNCSLDLGQSLCWVSRIKPPKRFWLFNVFKAIKDLALALKKLYSLPKKLYQFITNLLFLANMPTLGQVAKKFTSKLRRILDPVTFLIGQLALGNDIYLCNIRIAQRYMLTKHRKTNLPQAALTGGTSIILLQCFFSFKIRQQDFIVWKSKRSWSVVYCSFHPEVWTSTFPSRASKISDQTLVMLTEVLRL